MVFSDLDTASQRIGDLLLKGLKLDPGNLVLKYRLAQELHRGKRAAPEREENERRRLLEEILEKDPHHLGALHELALYYENVVGNHHKADSYVERALRVRPDFPDCLILKASGLARKGLGVEALRLIEELKEGAFSQGNQSLCFFVGKTLEAEGRLPEARKAFEKVLEFDFTHIPSRQSLIDLLERTGEYGEVLSILEEFITLQPFDVGAMLRRSRIYDGQDDLRAARDELLRVLRICPESFEALARLGNIYHKMELEEEAFEAWEKGLAVQPGNTYLRRYMDYLRREGILKEEEFAGNREALIAAAAGWEGGKEGTVFFILQKTVSRVFPDGRTHRSERRIVRILSEEGARQLQRIPILYMGGEQGVTVKLAQVIHPDGREEEGIVHRDQGGFSQLQNLPSAWVVEFPSLEPGDVLEIQYRIEDLTPGLFGNYFGTQYSFQGREPIFLSRFVLVVPRNREFVFHSRGEVGSPEVSEGEEERIYRWEMRKLPGLEGEALMPDPGTEIFPSIEVSTFKDWNELAQWYWGLIQRQGKASEEIRKAARDLAAGKEKREDKIRAIYDFVTSKIRYQPWEFGIYGYKPYPAEAVFARRFGDCKDKAILMNTMLGVLGIQAFPVLVRASQLKSEEDLTLPRFEHFNHCISFVPGEGGERDCFLDGTSSTHPMDFLPWPDCGSTALIIREDGGELREIPIPPPERNLKRAEAKVFLEEQGGAEILIRFQFLGEPAAYYRSIFSLPGKRRTILERNFAQIWGGAELKDFSFSSVQDRYVPFEYSVRLWVPAFARKRDGAILFQFIVFPEGLSQLGVSLQRRYDLLLPPPSRKEERVTYRFPEGYSLKELPAGREFAKPFGEYCLAFEREDGGLLVFKTFVMRAARIACGEYAGFRDFVSSVDRAEKEEAVLEK